MSRLTNSAATAVSLKAGAALLSIGIPLLVVAFVLVLVVVLVVVMTANMASNTNDDTETAGVHCADPDGADDDSDSGTSSPETEVPSEYLDYVESAAAEAQVPVEVLAAQIYYESNWQTEATSHAGAAGIAQFTEPTWASYGEGSFSNANDPEMAIAAQGRYMAELRDQMEPHADGDEDQLLELTLAAYNAGPGGPEQFDYDLDAMFSSGGDYETETLPYVSNITAAAGGMSGSFCSVPQGDIVEASMELAWADHRTVENPGGWQSNPRLGEEEARPEYVETAEAIHENINAGFFTDCGAFVATVMRSSGIDPNYQLRGTTQQQPYLQDSEEWETFTPTNEGELEPGDVLIANYSGGGQGEGGHTYIYTGDRADTEETYARAQGASLGQRPPSGHAMVFSAPGGVSYMAARHTGSSSDTEES